MILKKLSERFGIAGEMLKTLERRLLKAVMKAEAKYWIPRVVEQEREFNHAAEEFAKIISAPILRSGNTLTEKLERIYTNFQSAFDLSDEEAKKIIDQAETDRSFTDIIKATAENMSEGEAKRRALAEISAPAYKYRIEQTENLLKNEKEMLEGLARGEIRAETEFFQTEAEKAMSITVENVSGAREAAAEAVRGELGIHVRSETEKAVEEAFAKQEQGVYSSFNFISRERVDKIVNTDWSGRHFSERVWRNTEKLSSEIKDIMLHAELTGESFSKISADLQKKYGVRAYESLRLIKTETNYITNQAELDDLKARGVEQYELVAKLDDVTSKICEAMDGNVYNVAEAVVGVNYPPFHPNCRTRAFGHIGEQQAAEDLEDIVDGMDFDEMEKYLEEQGMTWDEWLEKDMEQIREEQEKSTLNSVQESAEENIEKTVDNSEKSGIIEVGKEEMTENDMLILSSKFINPNDDLYKYADKIQPELGFDDIVCHGDPYHLLINGNNREEWEYSAKDAADMIRNSREFKGESIRLIACQTGAKDDGLAQQIADILNVSVKAPTESVYVNPKGELFITDNAFLADMWERGIDVKETGKWKVFEPRKE